MAITRKPNPLGELPAEADHAMLGAAFYETPDYKTLLEHTGYNVIVGRRGVGKSAMFFRLSHTWGRTEHVHLVQLSPEQHQVVGLRALVKQFGEKFNLICAGSRIAWRYALLMEATKKIWGYYKLTGFEGEHLLRSYVGQWDQKGQFFCDRLRQTLRPILDGKTDPETAIADLPSALQVDQIQSALLQGLAKTKEQILLIIDRLDEGYEPDALGIGLLVGLVQASVDINTRFKNVRSVLFLRDNIYRAVSRNDPNFSRTVEGHVLRLHWEEYDLFTMICNRLRVAFGLSQESSLKIWNDCTAHDLQGKDGFRRCLKHTLYRPRDLLALLNQAYYHAFKQNRDQIVYADVESVAKEISRHRLEDLIKEYEVVFPGMEKFISCFARRAPELAYAEAEQLISVPLYSQENSQLVQQHLAILEHPKNVIRSLHSVGFLGLQDPSSKTFIFCHDGKSDPIEPKSETKMLVHPCYWLALDCVEQPLTPEEAAEIHDEYDIEVSSQTREIRNHRLGQVMNQLTSIPVGDTGAHQFEEWCEQAIKIVFAGNLRNIALKPNGNSIQRRDIVGTNYAQTPAWKRILEDYQSRQIIFEAKNYTNLVGSDEYRQMLSYLCNNYGKSGFIVTRAENTDLEKGKELDWMREIYFNHDHRLIIKLPAKFLVNLLSKLRSPQKHDAADEALNGLIDLYERRYLNLPTQKRAKK